MTVLFLFVWAAVPSGSGSKGAFARGLAVSHGRLTTARTDRIRTSLHSAIDRVHDLTEGAASGGLNKSLVLRYPEPQPTFFSQLVPDVRYITSMSYGGHANQLVGIINLLYLAKLTNRVAIM